MDGKVEQPYWCLALDATDTGKKKVSVDAEIILAVSQEKAKERYLLRHSETLGKLEDIEILTAPFVCQTPSTPSPGSMRHHFTSPLVNR